MKHYKTCLLLKLMTNVNTDGLPPEMQARIAQIIEQAKSNVADTRPSNPVPAPVQDAPLAPKPPTLMDHVILLRQEVAALRQELNAMGQVTEAVGNAVGQLYQMFHQQTETSTYSSQFQTQQDVDEDY
jgi:HAMP domain-containing protein